LYCTKAVVEIAGHHGDENKMAVYWDAGWTTLQRRLVAMEAVSTYETSGNLYKTTARSITKDSHFQEFSPSNFMDLSCYLRLTFLLLIASVIR
jgi:hypothetical protein